MFSMDCFAHAAHEVLVSTHKIGAPDFGVDRLPEPIVGIYPDLHRRMQRALRFCSTTQRSGRRLS